MLRKLRAWWPAEEEEESLLFKGIVNNFFSSSYTHRNNRNDRNILTPAGVVAGMLGAWWPAEEEESLLFKGLSTVLITSSPGHIRCQTCQTCQTFPLCRHGAGVVAVAAVQQGVRHGQALQLG
jgi:hypothetical protein